MRLVYSHEWPVHQKVTSEEAGRKNRPKEGLHEIYDIGIALDTRGYGLDRSRLAIRSLSDNDVSATSPPANEEALPSPCLYVSAGFPCRTLLVFDQSGCHIADVSLSLHSAVHIAGVPATNRDLLRRYHIGRLHIHQQLLFVADCEFDLVYVCNLAGDVRHVISWPEELCAPMGMSVGDGRLYVCDSGHRRVRVYNLGDYRPVPGEDAPGHFVGVHTRGVCQCGRKLVAGDFESGQLLVLDSCPPSTVAGCWVRALGGTGLGEPFDIVPGPLPDTVLVSSSSIQGDHSIKLLSIAPPDGPQHQQQAKLLASCGGPGSGPGQFNKPRGLAVDHAARRLYAVDARNYRIQVFSWEAEAEPAAD